MDKSRPDDLLTKRIAELESQLAEAREDARRLTDAEKGQYSMRYNAMNERWEINTGELHPSHRRFVVKNTLRSAIDAARGAK